MHLELSQDSGGHWLVRTMLGKLPFMISPAHNTRQTLDEDLARMAKALGDESAARIPVVTKHEYGGQAALRGDGSAAALAQADGAEHAVAGATEFASLADWLPRDE